MATQTSSGVRLFTGLFGAAVSLIPGFQGVGIAIALGGSLAAGAYDARKARRQIEQNKKQRDLSIAMPTAARRRIYGTDRVQGVLRYWTTHGAEQRFLSLVYVFADHPCEAITDIQFDDKSIGPLDDGRVQTGSPWFKSSQQLNTSNIAATAGTITLPQATTAMPSVTVRLPYEQSPSPINDAYTYVEVVSADITHTVGTTTITLGGRFAGATIAAEDCTVNWKSDFGKALARVRVKLGAVPQTADATLVTDSNGEWTTACRLDNQCYAIVTLEWDETTAANGIPVVSAIVKGARVFDPRSNTTAWSDNWALCIRDYIKFASGCSDSEIDDASVIESANIADQDVTVAEGTIKRYRIDGSIETTTDPVDALQDMALAGGGTVTWSAGKFRVLAGAYRTPVSITLSDADLAGGYQYQGEISREDRFNSVIGVYHDARPVDGTALYTRTDYAAYESSAYITEDNSEKLERRIDLPYITDYRRANMIGKQIMRRARQGARISAPWKLKALPLEVGDVVNVSLKRPGLVSKPFEVVSTKYVFPNAVELVLQETAAACYDWSYTEVAYIDPAPNTMLGSPTAVATPRLSVRCTADSPATIKTLADGSQIPYARVSWPARTNASEFVQIRWKRSFETGYRTLNARPSETEIDIEGISGGDTLQILGYAVNALGARSEPWIIQAYAVDSRLPGFAGEVPPLSANLLRNATLEVNTAKWSAYVYNAPGATVEFRRYTDSPPSVIAGTPSNAVLFAYTSLSGNGRSADLYSDDVSVEAGTRYAGFASLISYGARCVAAIVFYDRDGTLLEVTYGNLLDERRTPSQNFWNDPANYNVSSVFATAPANATRGRLLISMPNDWWEGTAIKFCSVYKPFLGVVDAAVTALPAWDPGGQNIVDTGGIARNSTFNIRRALPIAGPVAFAASAGPIAQVPVYDDLTGYDITVNASFDLVVDNSSNGSARSAHAYARIDMSASGTTRYGAPRNVLREDIAANATKTVHFEVTQRFAAADVTGAAPWVFSLVGQAKAIVPLSVTDVEFVVEILKR